MKFNFESWQEFLDWNVKRENHIKELEQHNYELEVENRRLRNQEDEENHELYGAVNRFVDTIEGFNIWNNDMPDTPQDFMEASIEFVKEIKDMQKKNATAENSDE